MRTQKEKKKKEKKKNHHYKNFDLGYFDTHIGMYLDPLDHIVTNTMVAIFVLSEFLGEFSQIKNNKIK